jgi:hypothetical protein
VLPFLHDRQTRCAELLDGSTAALRAYSARDLGTSEAVHGFLDSAAQEYRALGLSSGENELVGLLAQFTSAREGVNPVTSERVSLRRREMERSVALRVLEIAAERIRTDHASVGARLEQAREQLAPLVVHALGAGLVTPAADGTLTQSDLEQTWLRLLNDPETASAARLIAMHISAADVLLLIADLLAGLT